MSAAPIRFAAQGATPSRIALGAVAEVQTIFAHNPGAAGAYVKLYALAGTTAPDGAAVPIFSAFIGAVTALVLPVFIGGSNLWIAVATEAGAGLTGPASAFEISITAQL
jgi:hypothetical protein